MSWLGLPSPSFSVYCRLFFVTTIGLVARVSRSSGELDYPLICHHSWLHSSITVHLRLSSIVPPYLTSVHHKWNVLRISPRLSKRNFCSFNSFCVFAYKVFPRCNNQCWLQKWLHCCFSAKCMFRDHLCHATLWIWFSSSLAIALNLPCVSRGFFPVLASCDWTYPWTGTLFHLYRFGGDRGLPMRRWDEGCHFAYLEITPFQQVLPGLMLNKQGLCVA